MGKKHGTKRLVGLLLTPAAALWVGAFSGISPEAPAVAPMAAVAVLMAGWWMTEALPIPATALLPVALFPLLGILDDGTTAGLYFNDVVFLFLGGFVFALAMQRWKLHRRISLNILTLSGSSPRRLLFGFMLTTWFLSMWISNTASTMMVVPMAMSVTAHLRESCGPGATRRFGVALLLGIAYAASTGGLATLVGTPPNLAFARILPLVLPEAPEITFARWLTFAAPLSAAFLLISFGVLNLLLLRRADGFELPAELFRRERAELDRVTPEQRAVLVLFLVLVGGWVFRSDLALFGFVLPGWSKLLSRPDFVGDGTVAIFVALLLFVLPARSQPGKRLMNWKAASDLPWGIVLLFGGGFALAAGFRESGLSEWLGARLAGLEGTPSPVLVVTTSTALTFLTEVSSNTATAQTFLPVLASLAVSMGENPLLLMVPATLSASCAFMLPVATPPNAIVFGTGELEMSDMIRVGVLLNLIGIALVAGAVYWLGGVVLDIEPGVLPPWATER